MDIPPSPAFDDIEIDTSTDDGSVNSQDEGLHQYLQDRTLRQRQLAASIALVAEHVVGQRSRSTHNSRPTTSILVDHGRAISVIDGWTNGSVVACWDSIGMYPPAFHLLVTELEDRDLVSATLEIPVRVKVGVTLWLLRKSASNRTTREVWQLAQATVSKCFHEVIDALFSPDFYLRYVRLATPQNMPLDHPRYQDPKYKRLLRRCLGAIDGTLTAAHVPSSQHKRFRTRKKTLSWNVMAACDFEGFFTYVLAGWEGPANDAKVLRSAFEEGFDVADGYYYLADAGYPLTSKTIVPYRSTRYHLREWMEASNDTNRPTNPAELFNLRHSSCRNVIERSFGVLKARYPILAHGCRYNIDTQLRVIYSCFALHNFIMLYGKEEDDIQVDDDVDDGPDDENQRVARAYEENDRGRAEMEVKRDKIAERFWVEYEEVRTQRSRR